MIHEITERVEAFVGDFHQRWERYGKPSMGFSVDRGVYERWSRELAELIATHGVPGARTGEEGAMSSNPAHDPAVERITEVRVDGDQAMVRSIMGGASLATYYEYRLVRRDGQWLIAQLLSFLDPPGALLVDAQEAARLLDGATDDAPLSAIDPALDLDLPRLFAAGRQVVFFNEPAILEVVSLGRVTCKSGVLTVRDFGYGNFDLEPLTRRVPPGTYPVEVATVGRTNVALRLQVSELPAVSWHPAYRTNGSHVVGVDAGNVAILDLATLVRCDAQQVEEAFETQAERLSENPGTVFSLGGETDDSVMVTSGYGDGAYPCYWGVAADGSLAVLVADFLVLVEGITATVTAPWRTGLVSAPELDGCDLTISEDAGSFTFTYRGEQIRKIRVLDPSGQVLLDGDRLGLMVTGDLNRQTWHPAAQPSTESVLEVTLDQGYRHI